MTISYKSKTNLISKLLEQENIQEFKKQNIFSKIFSKKDFADIYFHSGTLDFTALENIKNAKLVIVNSQNLKHKIILHTQDDSNIEVVYPSIDIVYEKPKEIKKQFCQEYNIDKKKNIILFTAKDFKTSGIKEFMNIIRSLQNDNFHTIIAGDKKQITALKFQMKNIQEIKNLTLLEDYTHIDKLFLLSDIFILPSHKQNFAKDVLKAMFCKCAVFVSAINYANELVDIFSTMDEPDDKSMIFKVNALLENKEDLKQIKKENRQKALNYTLDKNLSKINELISQI